MYRYRPPCYHATTTVLIPRPYIGQQSILLPLLLHHAIMQHPASSAVGGGSNFRFGTAWDTCVSFETLETPLGHMCLIWDTLGTLWDTSWDTCLNDRQNFTNRVSCSRLGRISRRGQHRRGGQGFFVLIPTYIGDYRRRNKFRRHENYFVTHVTLTYQSTVCYYAARRDKLLPT